jgi:hypothetical protein
MMQTLWPEHLALSPVEGSCSGSLEPLLLGAGAGSSGHIRRTYEKSKNGAVHDKVYGVVRGFGINQLLRELCR